MDTEHSGQQDGRTSQGNPAQSDYERGIQEGMRRAGGHPSAHYGEGDYPQYPEMRRGVPGSGRSAGYSIPPYMDYQSPQMRGRSSTGRFTSHYGHEQEYYPPPHPMYGTYRSPRMEGGMHPPGFLGGDANYQSYPRRDFSMEEGMFSHDPVASHEFRHWMRDFVDFLHWSAQERERLYSQGNHGLKANPVVHRFIIHQ